MIRIINPCLGLNKLKFRHIETESSTLNHLLTCQAMLSPNLNALFIFIEIIIFCKTHLVFKHASFPFYVIIFFYTETNRRCMHHAALVERRVCIRKTCPCIEYLLEPHFYIAKLGYAGVYLFFLFLFQNIDCRYSLEPPRRGGSNVYPQSMF